VSGRARFALVGQAIRESAALAREADCSPAEWRVLFALVELVASYSRLEDKYAVARVAAAAGLHRKTAGRALRRLADRGVVVYRPGAGRAQVSLVGFPSPDAEKVAQLRPLSTEPDPDEPADFTEAIAALRPTPEQRAAWLEAYREHPVGFERVVEEARRDGRSPAALLDSKVRRGEHRGRAGRRGVSIAEVRAGGFGSDSRAEP
jgi:hypothetical protein